MCVDRMQRTKQKTKNENQHMAYGGERLPPHSTRRIRHISMEYIKFKHALREKKYNYFKYE